MMDNVTLWQGRPLDEYTKPELIRIVEQLGRMLTSEYERAQHEAAMTRAIRQRVMVQEVK